MLEVTSYGCRKTLDLSLQALKKNYKIAIVRGNCGFETFYHYYFTQSKKHFNRAQGFYLRAF